MMKTETDETTREEILEQQDPPEKDKTAEDSVRETLEQLRLELSLLREREQEREAQQQKDREEAKLRQEFPDLDPHNLPAEVLEDIVAGRSPREACRDYENRVLKTKIKMLEQNERNRSKAPGSVGSDAPPACDDPFVLGFAGE